MKLLKKSMTCKDTNNIIQPNWFNKTISPLNTRTHNIKSKSNN